MLPLTVTIPVVVGTITDFSRWQAWSLTFTETLHDKVYEKHTGIKQEKSATAYVSRELGRAAIFLCTEPIVMALALTTTFLFG